MGHAYNITINSKAKIGRNCNIHNGVVIGQANRGLHKGYPIIGNLVWIGINAVIRGDCPKSQTFLSENQKSASGLV